jgi:NAD(P)-dependent dehydrogenase (short-subunit alcohol dehydrogenase family)
LELHSYARRHAEGDTYAESQSVSQPEGHALVSIHANLEGKVAFVTGASSGIGAHCANLLAQAGATVVLAARRRSALEELGVTIAATGGRAIAVTLDVRDIKSVEAAVAEAVRAVGPISILVNNSGVAASNSVLNHTEEEWDSVIDTNLKGAFLMSTAVARVMRDAKGGGSIINIASILGLRQAGGVAAYATSKAGLVQLTKVLALELARYSIRVNAIAPGYIETELNRDFWRSESGVAMLKRIPQRRLGQFTDLDGLLLLLASDVSSYMTGSVIAIDGGHLVSTL